MNDLFIFQTRYILVQIYIFAMSLNFDGKRLGGGQLNISSIS